MGRCQQIEHERPLAKIKLPCEGGAGLASPLSTLTLGDGMRSGVRLAEGIASSSTSGLLPPPRVDEPEPDFAADIAGIREDDSVFAAGGAALIYSASSSSSYSSSSSSSGTASLIASSSECSSSGSSRP